MLPENQTFLIPLMPEGIFKALQQLSQFHMPEKLVNEGDSVQKGDSLIKYGQVPVTAPFSGKIVLFNRWGSHCHLSDWKDDASYPEDPARRITGVTLFALQPLAGENTINVVYKSYLQIIKAVNNALAEAKRDTMFAGKNSALGAMYGDWITREFEEFRQQTFINLGKLKNSEAKIAPVSTDFDEYFRHNP